MFSTFDSMLPYRRSSRICALRVRTWGTACGASISSVGSAKVDICLSFALVAGFGHEKAPHIGGAGVGSWLGGGFELVDELPADVLGVGGRDGIRHIARSGHP